jgi:hypothetical protein
MVWETAGYETVSVSKAMIKVKLLLGTYILQSNRHKFNRYEVRPDCPLCNSGEETDTVSYPAVSHTICAYVGKLIQNSK